MTDSMPDRPHDDNRDDDVGNDQDDGDERDELQAMGFATVMRHRIMRFFGQAGS